MERLKSNKFKLPEIFFITDREKIKDLPPGIPFIYGNEKDKDYIIRMLEYEVLWLKAKKSNYSFNFRQLLKDAGFNDLTEYNHFKTAYIDVLTEDNVGKDWNIDESKHIGNSNNIFREYIKDSTAYVDIQKLKDLKIIPVWVDTIEQSIVTNIHNFATFNHNMYNKKLDGMFGGLEFNSPKRNLIVCDISSSIPKAVSTITLLMSKNMGETFYADILVTGAISVLYPYEILHELDVESVYAKVGMSNEQTYFKKLLTSEEKHYGTAIVYGDNNHPGQSVWGNGAYNISDEDGKKMTKWKIDKLISLHTDGTDHIAGYARWFDVPESNIQRIDNWVQYLK